MPTDDPIELLLTAAEADTTGPLNPWTDLATPTPNPHPAPRGCVFRSNTGSYRRIGSVLSTLDREIRNRDDRQRMPALPGPRTG